MNSEVSPSAHTARGKLRLLSLRAPGHSLGYSQMRLPAARAAVIWPSASTKPSMLRREPHDLRATPTILSAPSCPTRLKEPLARPRRRPARRPHLHGQGPVRHRRPQGLQRQSRLVRRMPRPAPDTAPRHPVAARRRAHRCTGITICDEFFYSVLGSNAHYGSRSTSARRTRHRRLVLRLGSGGRGLDVRLRARQRHRRLDPRAGLVLRALWLAAHSRPHRRSTARRRWRRATTRSAILAREAELFRNVGHVLLDGDRVDARRSSG